MSKNNYEKILSWYLSGRWKEKHVRQAEAQGALTKEEADKILSEKPL